jgi:multidrug efflux pump
MSISAPFILRPIATTLLTFAVFLAGAAAYFLLPVSSLPQVDIPTISVSASLPGASPEVVAATVATPLERHLGEIADVTEMTSRSSIGQTQIVLQFGLHRDLDGAARDVQAAIEAARADLPSSLRSNPSYRKFNPAAAPIMVLTLLSKTRTQGQLYDLASNILQPALSQVTGVGNVGISGSSLPAIRVELNPRALFKYGIGLADVRAALAAGNANTPKGAIEVGDRRYQIYANDVLTSDVDRGAALYGSLIIASRNGAVVRLSDVAEVVGSVEDIRNAAYCDGEPCVVLQVSQQPGANLIDTVDHITSQIPRLQATLPPDVQLAIRNDQTAVIRGSLKDTGRTLIISTVLVILIVYLFLRSWRATIIPCVAVPVSLVGTFGIMYLFGFTIDNISLMALTVATGFVVDDAIVVLENTTRHIEAGMPRLQAALLGAEEVAFTVLSMTVSLCAVFLPIPLMGGPVGQLFKEFSITLSAAIGISLVVSLTTTPMLCALLLRPHVPVEEKSKYKRWLDTKFDKVLAGYSRTLKWALENGSFIMILLGIVIVLNVHLYGLLPKGYFPWMDQGRIQGGIRGDQSASFELTRTKVEAFEKIIRADPAVESVQLTTGAGGGGGGGGFVSVTLKPKAVRKLNTEEVINRMRPMLAEVPGANAFLFTPQDIRVGGRQGNSPFQYTLLSDDVEALREWGPKLEAALKEVPQLLDVSTDQQERGLETEIQIDRATASRFNLTTSQVSNALQDAFAQRSVSTIYNQFNQYHVIMEVAKEFWQSPETLQDLFISTFGQISGTQATAAVSGTTSAKGGDTAAAEAVRNQATNKIANTGRGAASTGAAVSTRVETMVPFAALSKYGSGSTPTSISHQGHFAAVTVSFSVAPGYALSDVTRIIPAVANEIGMPPSVHGTFAGTAGAFQSSLSAGPLLILAAIVTIYIVLGILYESYVHPLTIISTLPTAGIGAFILLKSMDMELGLIAFIGLILLIGIVKKNAIIMVDFAIAARRDRGLNHHDAIFEACILRFRPIMMTSAAAILGALPLAIGFGEGTELRRPLGVTILGGLLVSQLLTIYTTPVIYLYLAQFGGWVSTSRRSFGTTVRGWFSRKKTA